MSGLHYLVTGGAGFIGSNLVRHLLETRPDARVTNLDALTYAGNLESLADVEADPELAGRHRFVHADICDGEALPPVLGDIDVVLHLAAESHVDRSIQSGAPFVRTNVLGTQTLLRAALDAGVARFVHVSTDEVYGELPWRDPAEAPAWDPAAGGPPADDAPLFTEETPLQPRSPYAASKAASDHLARAYHLTHGMDVVITRCSNNYGPYQFPEKLIPLMVTHALADEPLPVYGDGLHVRDWIQVLDHCRGILAAADEGRSGEAYNFGGAAERTNLAVVHGILDALDKPRSLVEHVEDRPGHDRRYAIDFRRAHAELGWTPTVAFEEGLKATVAWYLKHRTWWERVQSGAYWDYHREQYGARGPASG